MPAAIGVPGFASTTDYDVINLSFILVYGTADAASVWEEPFGFLPRKGCSYGSTKEEV